MKRILLVFSLCILAYGCSSVNENTLTQVSTIDALLAGYYDGVMPLDQLSKYGNFGIGTFNKLDGEMIVLDGTIYQFKSDGKIYKADLNNTTPFASVVEFKGNSNTSIRPVKTFVEFQSEIDKTIKNKNLFYAVKVTGKFSYIKTRTVPAQEKPYKPLSEVTKTQPTFEKKDVDGTLVGFLLPAFTSGVNVPGYHLHFLSADKTFGGHVLELSIEEANVEIQEINNFYMTLPEDDDAFGKIDLSKDRSKDLNQVEK